jgi:hypothetical protein
MYTKIYQQIGILFASVIRCSDNRREDKLFYLREGLEAFPEFYHWLM